MEMDYRKVKKMVPQKFYKWLKVFGKVESKRISVRKVWDYVINLRDDFRASKARIYLLSRNEKEEVQKFINKHLKNKYIRPFKLPQTLPMFFVGTKDKRKTHGYGL